MRSNNNSRRESSGPTRNLPHAQATGIADKPASQIERRQSALSFTTVRKMRPPAARGKEDGPARKTEADPDRQETRCGPARAAATRPARSRWHREPRARRHALEHEACARCRAQAKAWRWERANQRSDADDREKACTRVPTGRCTAPATTIPGPRIGRRKKKARKAAEHQSPSAEWPASRSLLDCREAKVVPFAMPSKTTWFRMYRNPI